MPGCAALNCKNRTEKGFRMHCFPKNPERKYIWTKNCGRSEWEITNCSNLCEVHFEENQFEQRRADGRRLLKPNAVPTIFEHVGDKKDDKKITRKTAKKVIAEPSQDDAMDALDPEHSYCEKVESSVKATPPVTRGMTTRSATKQSNETRMRSSKRVTTEKEKSPARKNSRSPKKAASTASQTKSKEDTSVEKDPKPSKHKPIAKQASESNATQKPKGAKRKKELNDDWSSFDWSMFEEQPEPVPVLQSVDKPKWNMTDKHKRGSKMYTDACCQTDLTLIDISKMEDDLVYASKEMSVLRKKVLDVDFTEETLKESEEEVDFYTGMPTLTMLMTVFNFIVPHITTCSNKLNSFTEFLIFMIHMRFNLSLEAMGFKFGAGVSVVFRIVDRWLVTMHEHLGIFVSWPERQLLKETMPLDFKYLFGDRVAVIVDCFEVYVDKHVASTPSAALASYKHQDTVKFVIGITPQGAIAYISEPWDGRICDQDVIERCDIMDYLLPEDIIVARSGFGFYCAQVVIPDEDTGEKILVNLEMPQNRLLSKLKIHMDKLVGVVCKKYQIVQSPLYVEYEDRKERIEYINKVVKVCCALTNLSNSGLSCETYEEI